MPKLEALLDEPMIGIDSEWSPLRLSLLQISGKNAVFLVDLLALKDSLVLDQTLTRIVSNESSTVIGFDFRHDKMEFSRKLPLFGFIMQIKRFIDVQAYYGKVM